MKLAARNDPYFYPVDDRQTGLSVILQLIQKGVKMIKLNKSDIAKRKREFIPFSITLDINTREDAQGLYFIFNYLPIIESILHGTDQGEIRKYIMDQSPEDIDTGGSFEHFQQALRKQITLYS